MMRRIAILMRENQDERHVPLYLVNLMADTWREDGHEVIHLFGTGKFVPADILIVHVDLTIVPAGYFEFAARYPVVVNGKVRDIRKSTYSTNLVRRGDAWGGPVIVKSDLNRGGNPERGARRNLLRSAWRAVFPKPRYRIYKNLEAVPGRIFDSGDWVVQKFEPEREGEMYCIRFMGFFGDRITCIRLTGHDPIVSGEDSSSVEVVEPHADIVAARDRFQFDYGKFDYVVVGGRAILLDANKTIGCSPKLRANKDVRERWEYRARGLYAFFR